MSIQTFTAAQVLTAAQMNTLQANDYNQTVATKTASYTLVAADKGTRVIMNVASANTVTVNTSLFSASDTLIIQNIGAGVTTVTAGTATVSSAGPLAIPQNGSGMLYFTSAGVSIFYPSAVTVAAPAASALTLITAATVTSSAQANITNCFSTTYSNYRLLIRNQTFSANALYTNVRFGTSGTPDTAGTYNWNAVDFPYTGVLSGPATQNATEGYLGFASGTSGNAHWAEITTPFESLNTFMFGNSVTSASAGQQASITTLRKVTTTSYTDLVLFASSGTFSFDYQIYGYQKS
jgi:hypothetical protein